MDEPLSALDVYTKQRLREEILQVWERTRKTVVFVTHDVDEALYLADRIIVFSRKPTRVVRNVVVPEPRPRAADESAALRALRAEILGSLSAARVSPREVTEGSLIEDPR
jgi:NitT/TauT family transport system ATP-binding protein